MKEVVLLLGNGVNKINNNTGWDELLNVLHENFYADTNETFNDIKNKPFPLVYEQIVMWQLSKGNRLIEKDLKTIIAQNTSSISSNEVHSAVNNGKWKHIITSNYEFNFMGEGKSGKLINSGCIAETKYSIFRHYENSKKKYWHLHGDIQNLESINLGYEHYCGQLQKMREYVTGSYRCRNEALNKLFTKALLKRKYIKSDTEYSWIDLFFKDNITIKIIGLRLDFEEIDLWWLLTYRAKMKHSRNADLLIPKNNVIKYYIPKKYVTNEFLTKKAFMEKMAIDVITIELPDTTAFYLAALENK